MCPSKAGGSSAERYPSFVFLSPFGTFLWVGSWLWYRDGWFDRRGRIALPPVWEASHVPINMHFQLSWAALQNVAASDFVHVTLNFIRVMNRINDGLIRIVTRGP